VGGLIDSLGKPFAKSPYRQEGVMATFRVLVVDDDESLRHTLLELLRGAGYEVTGAGSAEEAIALCRLTTFHLVLCDLHLPGRDGIAVVRTLASGCPETKVILLTAHASVRSAVTALKRGAAEYVLKPVHPRRLLALVRAHLHRSPAYLPNHLMEEGATDWVREGALVTRSPRMIAVIERMRRAGATALPVVVAGEAGSGKQTVARALHERRRPSGPFVSFPARAAGDSPEAGMAELLGCERASAHALAGPGALERASGGTLYVRDADSLPEAAIVAIAQANAAGQVMRLGARRPRPIDVQLIFGTQGMRELSWQVFIMLAVPPLRDRDGDVPLLVDLLLGELRHRHGSRVFRVAPAALRLLEQYDWPGNVTELRRVVEQAVLLAPGDCIDVGLLPETVQGVAGQADVIRFPIGTSMGSIEREVILRTLAAHKGNKTLTAEVLGISRRSIYNKLAEYGLGDVPPRAVFDDRADALAAAAGGLERILLP
jgi:DNA-binding NtrC family response regulator